MPYKTGSWGTQAKDRAERIKNDPLLHKSIGWAGEIFALNIFKNSKRVDKIHDLEWKGKKIEVKTSGRIYPDKRYRKGQWHFSIKRQIGLVNYFLLICLDENKKEIVKIYLIPNDKIKSKDTISLGEKSQYDNFLIKKR